MGYLFLALSLLTGITKGYCGKMTGNIVNGFKDAALANAVRMLICIIIGFVIALVSKADFRCSAAAAWICILSGTATAVFVATWLVIVKKGAYMMIDVFIMLGTLIPVLFSVFLLKETVGIFRIIGIAVIVAAVLIMCSYNNSIKEKINVRSLILLIVCGSASGFSDLSQKLLVTVAPETSISVFNLYTYIISAIILFGFFLLIKNNEKESSGENIKKAVPYVVIMAICLFATTFFRTMAAKYLSAAVLYPLSQGLALILSACMSVVFFKERLNSKGITGICTAAVGIIILNLS